MYFHFKFLEKNNGIQTRWIKALKHTFIKWNHEKDFILKVRIPREICSWSTKYLIYGLFQVKRAMQRGATAIIFDTTDHPEAATEVSYIYIWVKFNSFMFIWIKDSCILAYWKFSEIKQPNTKVTFEQQSHWLPTCASLQQSCHWELQGNQVNMN